MARRLGNVKLQVLAKAMCLAVTKFSDNIARAYPENTALQLALLAANEACRILDMELEAIREYGD